MSAYIKLMKRVEQLENDMRDMKRYLCTVQWSMIRTALGEARPASETQQQSAESTAAQAPSDACCETSVELPSLPQMVAHHDVPSRPSLDEVELEACEY